MYLRLLPAITTVFAAAAIAPFTSARVHPIDRIRNQESEAGVEATAAEVRSSAARHPDQEVRTAAPPEAEAAAGAITKQSVQLFINSYFSKKHYWYVKEIDTMGFCILRYAEPY